MTSLDTLLDMAAFFKAHPPREGDREGPAQEVFLYAGQRLQLRMLTSRDIGYGLWRDEKLAEHGVFGADHDSRQFAQTLYEALADHLSIRNLEHLVEVFTLALASEEARRQAALTRLQSNSESLDGQPKVKA